MFSGKAKVYGIIANPVGHSMSPLLHRVLADSMSIDFAYVPLNVKEDLKKAIEGAYYLGFSGMNISIPYKQEVMKYLKDIDKVAKSIGAVNTLIRDKSLQGYVGYNTDMWGLKKALEDNTIDIEDRNIIILGCGGAAKAVIYMCLENRVKNITIFNRNREKAENIVNALKKSFYDNILQDEQIDIEVYGLEDLDSKLDKDDYIAFQTTSIGMYPNNNDIITKSTYFYDKVSIGVDLVYVPKETSFMKEFIKRDKKAISGLDMLINQGIISFELWNKIKIDEASRIKAKKEVEKFLGEV